MKSKRRSLVAAVVIFFCGAAFGVICSNTPSVAQIEAEAPPRALKAPVQPAPPLPAGPVGRYQISTYATSNSYGCYLLDTMTGEMWHSQNSLRWQAVKR